MTEANEFEISDADLAVFLRALAVFIAVRVRKGGAA
jgi:hypothetical protein